MKAKILVAGGAGFLGSHVCKYYLDNDYHVVCVDNLSTGRRKNIADLEAHERFEFIQHDICQELPLEITNKKYRIVTNLASPASPPKYYELAVETLMVGAVGTKNLLELARHNKARFFHASTSEVYGDPQVTPQTESYRGHVNTYGPRAMYDEAKRFSEAMVYVYRHKYGVNSTISRFFNTYGPHMDPQDGRVVSNLITQALKGEPLTVYGDGTQTRSFCYVDDLVAGIVAQTDSSEEGPMNLGNPHEFTVLELAQKVLKLIDTPSEIVYQPLPQDDPLQRRPDISYAEQALGWKPQISLDQGLLPTIDYFRSELGLLPDNMVDENTAALAQPLADGLEFA